MLQHGGDTFVGYDPSSGLLENSTCPYSPLGLANVEQLDPDPFLELMPRLGLTWELQELSAESIEPQGIAS
jgi:hypothetical protein